MDELILEGAELEAEGPCVEEGHGRVIIPRRGRLLDSDGQATIAVIRPCVSRGKRLKGMPPIYEAGMLGRNARVFEDWHMWMGHMSQPLKEAIEELEERLQESITARRLFSELGGRVTRTWFDPDFRSRRDEEMGYRQGAVMGKAIPYPASLQILEADPEGLHVSIAAWPTSARAASPSWDSAVRGMAIEGFRRVPRGSVDWVLRGGAGGQVVQEGLTEAERRAVSLLESYYDVADAETKMPNLKNMTLDQLRSQLAEENPDLAEELGLEEAAGEPDADDLKKGARRPGRKGRGLMKVKHDEDGGLTMEDVEDLLERQRKQLTEEFRRTLEDRELVSREDLEEQLAEERELEGLQEHAHQLIRGAGLTPGWTKELLSRYSVLPTGAGPGLLVEETEERTAEELVEENLVADVKHIRQLIAETGGTARVRGLGGGRRLRIEEDEEGEQPVRESRTGRGRRRSNAFLDFLKESGADLGRDARERETKLTEMVEEGVY